MTKKFGKWEHGHTYNFTNIAAILYLLEPMLSAEEIVELNYKQYGERMGDKTLRIRAWIGQGKLEFINGKNLRVALIENRSVTLRGRRNMEAIWLLVHAGPLSAHQSAAQTGEIKMSDYIEEGTEL